MIITPSNYGDFNLKKHSVAFLVKAIKIMSFAENANEYEFQGEIWKEGKSFEKDGEDCIVESVVKKENGDLIITYFGNDLTSKTMELKVPVAKKESISPQISKQTEPEAGTYTAYGETFKEGGSSYNFNGEYIIEKIFPDGKMTVLYTSGKKKGERQNLNCKTQAESHKNEKARQKNEKTFKALNLKGANESFTLGYLSQKGEIIVLAGPDEKERFEKAYAEITKDNAMSHLGHGYLLRKSKGGSYLRVVFPALPPEILNSMSFYGASQLPTEYSTGMQLNSHNYVMNLFRSGFLIGKNNHRTEEIRKHIDDQEAFDKGVAVANGVPIENLNLAELGK